VSTLGSTDVPIEDGALTRFEQTLGHRFRDRELLLTSLIHRSYAAEAGVDDSYERLEFLGDAVLQLSVTEHLYANYPELAEGEMAKVRAGVVNERTLAAVARELGVPEVLLLGRGEELTGGREKDSILSDVVESVLGALFLDAGYEVARDLIVTRWETVIDERALAPGQRDYKTRLQEWLARDGRRPDYDTTEEGPEHARRFTARVMVDGEVLGEGTGSSKKRAEQQAAQEAVVRLAAQADA
jgi:ribonuclease-3